MKYLCSFAMVLCLCSFAYGENVTVTWDGPVDPDNWENVTGFDLQINDVCIPISGNVRQWDGNVTLVEGTNVAILRAVADTLVSDWSEPCYFNRDISLKVFAPTVINIMVN